MREGGSGSEGREGGWRKRTIEEITELVMDGEGETEWREEASGGGRV